MDKFEDEDLDEVFKDIDVKIEMQKLGIKRKVQTFESLLVSKSKKDRELADRMYDDFEREMMESEYESQFHFNHI